MEFEEDALQNSTSGTARIIAALEQQISNLQTIDGNYTNVLQNIGIKAVQLNTEDIGEFLSFANVFPLGENPTVGATLEEENTQLYDDMDDIPLTRTAASISVPSSVITELNGKWYYSIKR